VMLPQRAPSSGAIDVRDGSALADDFSP
jgi:hypothetical protein